MHELFFVRLFAYSIIPLLLASAHLLLDRHARNTGAAHRTLHRLPAGDQRRRQRAGRRLRPPLPGRRDRGGRRLAG